MTLDTTDREGMPAFLDRRPTNAGKPLVYTYTNLNAYENCPHAMFRRYIKQDIPYVESPEMAYGTKVHKALEYRVGQGRPLPEEMRKWEKFATPFDNRQATTERKLGCTNKGKPIDFYDKTGQVWLRGKVDLAIEGATTAYMADWKTGKSSYESPFELEIGALLLKANNLALRKVVGNYVWLKEDRVGQQYDLSGFMTTWDKVNEIVARIEHDKAEGEFPKKKSGLCGWCSVKDCENWYDARAK